MPTVRHVLTAGVLTAGVMLGIAPAALAEPVPEPDPAPAPVASSSGDTAGCAGGEVVKDGNCVPAMTPVAPTNGEPAQTPLRYTENESSSTDSGLPVDLVPNINGESCTGYWTSGACYAQQFNTGPAVTPKSTLSSSP